MAIAKILLFLPAAAAAEFLSPREGMKSVVTELAVVLVFLATFSLTRWLTTQKPAPSGKARAKRDPSLMAEQVKALCVDQFTRGLRLYREMVRSDLDVAAGVGLDFYTCLVEASVRVGKPDVAEQVLERLVAVGTKPTAAFLESVLKLFAARKQHKECVMAWSKLGAAVGPSQVIYSIVVMAACDVGDGAVARQLLESMPLQCSREWLPLARLCAKSRDWPAALSIVDLQMRQEMPVDNVLYNTVLSAASPQEIEAATALHEKMRAYEAVHRDPSGPTVDVVSFNTLLKGLARRGDVKACFELFEQCCGAGVAPDDVSFSTLLDVCIDEDEHDLAAVALDRMQQHGVTMNCIVMTTLIKGFVRSQQLDKAMHLYTSMRSQSSQVRPDMITFSLLIKAHCDGQDLGAALQILEDMLEAGCAVDDVVFTHLIEGCCAAGTLPLAERLFADMQAAAVKPSSYTINSMVKAYGRAGKADKAVALVKSMEEQFGLKPNVVIFTCLVGALFRLKRYRPAWTTFLWMRGAGVQPDGHAYHTLLLGLTDGQMWTELVDAAEACAPLRSPKTLLPECFNYALNGLLARGQVAHARALHKIMLDAGRPVTVRDAQRKLAAP